MHNEELHNSYYSPHIVTVIKARRIRWAWSVARVVRTRNPYRVLVANLEGRRPLGRADIVGRTVLKVTLNIV
jgi:hypothetical protein